MISKKSKILATLSLSIIIGLGSHVLAAPKSTSEGVTNSTNMVRMFRGKGGLGNNGLNPLLEKIGLTMDEVASAKASGKTLFDLAEDKGYTSEQVRNMLIEIKTEAINQALTDGKITQEKADELINEVKEDVANCDGSMNLLGGKNKSVGLGGFSCIDVLGLTREDIASAKESGKTIFDLAKEKKGMTPEEVRAALIKSEADKINEMVSQGKITQEKADAMIAAAKERIENWDGNFQSSKPLQNGNFRGKMQRKNMKNFN